MMRFDFLFRHVLTTHPSSARPAPELYLDSKHDCEENVKNIKNLSLQAPGLHCHIVKAELQGGKQDQEEHCVLKIRVEYNLHNGMKW